MGRPTFPRRVTTPFLDVIEYLLAHPGAHGYAIWQDTGHRTATIYAVLDRLVEADWVVVEWVGTRRHSYVLTGAAAAQARTILAARRPPSRPPGRNPLRGLVVVVRQLPGPRRPDRPATGWTLHVATCGYLTKTNVRTQPAPRALYPNTVHCHACRPGHPHRRTRCYDAASKQFVEACACGDEARGATRNAARFRSRRNHDRADRIRRRP